MLNIDIEHSLSEIGSEYMQNYTIAIGGGGGLWVTGMWEDIVGYVKRGQKLLGCEKTDKQVIE